MAHTQENAEAHIPAEEMQGIQQALGNESLDSAVGKIQEYFEQLDRTELHIAVTGETGKGKSTFINAIRGLRNDDIDSAPTGVVETTMEPTPYPCAKYPNVNLWDLPGIGTENFKADQYLKLVRFDHYDFFIIIAERFTSNDANLAREIQKIGKRFYLIRSKIDQSLDGEKRTKKTYNEKTTLDIIRKDCITGLQKLNMTSPKVFLISSLNLEKYDFPQLQETMEKELPENKKHVFLLALPNTNEVIILKKKRMLQANIWKIALLSAAVAGVFNPALGICVDLSLLTREIKKYTKAFGLDEVSLSNLSKHLGVPVEEVKKGIKFRLDLITKDMVTSWLSVAASRTIVVDESIAIIRSIMAAGTSYHTTYRMLNDCLNMLAADACHVMVRAFLSRAEQTEV